MPYAQYMTHFFTTAQNLDFLLRILIACACGALKAQDLIDKPWKSVYPGKGHKCGYEFYDEGIERIVNVDMALIAGE